MRAFMSFAMTHIAFTTSAAPKVQLKVYNEAGCPPCQALIKGQLADLVAADGIADILELEQVPWGNAYYETSECGGGPYASKKRECWASTCVNASAPPADCFVGPVVSQHGETERMVNRMESCAKSVAATWQNYWPFLLCMEQHYDDLGLDATEACTAEAGLSLEAVQHCYDGGDGDKAVIRDALATPEHPGIPWVTINDIHVDDYDRLLKIVCEEYQGPKPVGCLKLQVVIVLDAGDAALIAGPIKEMLESKGVADIVDVRLHPWGNNYYKTLTCGGAPYSASKRHCWAQLCGRGSAAPPAECMLATIGGRGSIIQEQNDTKRMDALFYLTAAQMLLVNWHAYLPFALCFAEAYSSESLAAAAVACAKPAGLNATELEGWAGVFTPPIVDSQSTPDHPDVPYIAIDGDPISDVQHLLANVCSSYLGPKPLGCASSVLV